MSKGIIIYMGGFELPDKNAAAHRVIANGKIMRNLGYTVVFLGMNKTSHAGPKPVRSEQDFFGFECWTIPYPLGTVSWLKYIVGLPSIMGFILLERPEKVVCVICYNYPAVAQLRINKLCQKKNIKHLADATEWYDASGGSVIYRIVKWLDTTLRMHFVNLQSDGVLTTSNYLTTFYSIRKKITVELPTLFDTDNFNRPNLINNKERRTFIYVGVPFDVGRVNKTRTNLKERLDLSIEIFYQLYEAGELFDFLIYGISKDDYLAVFPEHQAPLSAMDKCVSFYGKQPNNLVREKIADCDFSIFFRDETRVTLAGFPSKLAESISCGTPVISNKMANIKSYADLAGIFLAEKNQAFSLIKKIISMSTQEMIQLKTEVFESKSFDYRKFEEQVQFFLEKVGV